MVFVRFLVASVSFILLSTALSSDRWDSDYSLWQSASGLPILSGLCTPVPSCPVDDVIAPEQLADKLYGMLGKCNGKYGLTPTRCDQFVTLSIATLQRDITGNYCLTPKGRYTINQLASAVLPEFPRKKPLKDVPNPSFSNIPMETVALPTPTSRLQVNNPQVFNGSERIDFSGQDIYFLYDYISIWAHLSWNGYSVSACNGFPTYREGTIAHSLCAALVCTTK